jgi:hypothetical protein
MFAFVVGTYLLAQTSTTQANLPIVDNYSQQVQLLRHAYRVSPGHCGEIIEHTFKISENLIANMKDSRDYRYPQHDPRRWFNYWGGLFK